MLQSSGLSGHNPQDYQVTILRIVRAQSVRLSGHNLYGCQATICTTVKLQSARLSGHNLHDCQGTICTIVWPQSARLSGRNLHDCQGAICTIAGPQSVRLFSAIPEGVFRYPAGARNAVAENGRGTFSEKPFRLTIILRTFAPTKPALRGRAGQDLLES